jgi:hypothetical protein
VHIEVIGMPVGHERMRRRGALADVQDRLARRPEKAFQRRNIL